MPLDSMGWAYLAQSYADLHEAKRAVACAVRLMRAKPDDPEAVAILAHALWMAKHRRWAKNILDNALHDWPDDGSLLHIKADIEEQAGNCENALVLAERALKVCPNNPSLYAEAAWLNMRVGDFDRAHELAKTGTRLFKFWPDLLTVWGLLLERKGDLQEASRVLLEAHERSDHYSDVYRPNLLLGLGRVAVRLERDEDADRWFDLAEKAGVDRAFLLQTKVEALHLAGRLQDAIQVQQEAAALEQNSAFIWDELATLCAEAGDYELAIKALRRADALQPDDVHVLTRLGVTLGVLGKAEEAVSVLQRAVELNPELTIAWEELGTCLYRLSRPKEAVVAFEKSGVMGSRSVSAGLTYSAVLNSLGRVEDALEQCAEIQARAPDDPRSFLLEATCHLHRGAKEAAQKAATKAIKVGRDKEEIVFGVMEVFLETGVTEKAVELWRFARSQRWSSRLLSQTAIRQCLQFAAREECDIDIMELLEYQAEVYEPDETNLLNRARCAVRLERLEESIERFGELLRLNPLILSAVEERAQILARLGRITDALSSSSSLYDDIPPWLVPLHMAHTAKVCGDLEQTTHLFLAAVRLLPDPPHTGCVEMQKMCSVAEHLDVRSDVEQAVGLADGSVSKNAAEVHLSAHLSDGLTDQLKRLRLAHQLDPERVLLAVDLAMAELVAGNLDEALRVAREVSQSGSPSTLSLASSGRVLLKAGAPPEETLAIAEEAVELAEPSDGALWSANYLKAESLNLLGRFEDALVAGQAALKSHCEPMTALAVIRSLQSLGKNGEALELAENASSLFSDDIEIKVSKSLLLNLAGRDEECIELVRSMGATGAVMVTPLLDMGDCLLRGERHEEALESSQSAVNNLERLRDEPNFQGWYVRAVNGVVSCLVAQGKMREALTILDTIGDSYLAKSGLWVVKVDLCGRHLNDHSAVLRAAQARLEVVTEDGDAHWYQAAALSCLGRYEEALAAVDQAVALKREESAESVNLRARVLAGLQRFSEAVVLISREIELRNRTDGKLDLSPVALMLDWLPNCSPPPATGLQLGSALLGAYCGPCPSLREAKDVFHRLNELDWQEVTAKAGGGDQACQLALAILKRAESSLKPDAQQAEQPARPEMPEQVANEPFLVGVLRTILEAKWPT